MATKQATEEETTVPIVSDSVEPMVLTIPKMPEDLSLSLGETGIMYYTALLATKILKVTHLIGALSKDGENGHHHYKYISHEQAATALRSILPKVGLLLIPQQTGDKTEIFKDTQGKTYHRTTVFLEILLIDAETGFTINVPWSGTEQDNGGKDHQQAITTAYKYWQFKQFLITDKSEADPDGKTTEIPVGAKRQTKVTDPFFANLPSNLKYKGSQPEKNSKGEVATWITAKHIKTIADRYKKEPTEPNALNLLTGARVNFKVSKENYKKLITIMNLVDEEGNKI